MLHYDHPDEKRVRSREALAATGMPHEFAAQMMILAHAFGITIAIRAATPGQLYLRTCVPKPSSVKHKTCDWGPAKQKIPRKAHHGRYQNGKPINAGKAVPEHIHFMQDYSSLRTILRELEDPESGFELISADSSYIYVKALDAPEGTEFVYRYDLSKGMGMPKEEIETEHINVNFASPRRSKPDWWNDDWGTFSEKLDYSYPYATQDGPGKEFEPEEIFALQTADMNLVPITGDMDLLWISLPADDHPLINEAKKFGVDICGVVNTFTPEGLSKMRTALEVMTKVDEHKYLNLDEIDDERLKLLGCITPFEAYILFIINQNFGEYAPHILELFQHGCDNRHPGTPSNLDGGVLHISGAEIILTNNEKDLISFVLERSEKADGEQYLQGIEVHPRWNMAMWHPVVKRQLDLGLEVPEDVRTAYGLITRPDASPLIRKASIGFEAFAGNFRRSTGNLRRSLSNTFAIDRKNSAPDSPSSPVSPTQLGSSRKSSLAKLFSPGRRSSAPSALDKQAFREIITLKSKATGVISDEKKLFLSNNAKIKLMSFARMSLNPIIS